MQDFCASGFTIQDCVVDVYYNYVELSCGLTSGAPNGSRRSQPSCVCP
jgi:hypothetical protein